MGLIYDPNRKPDWKEIVLMVTMTLLMFACLFLIDVPTANAGRFTWNL